MDNLGVKDRIIEAASHLFYNAGYNQTGINQIIAEANVAKASMYQHFRSKEDIAVAYLQKWHTKWVIDSMVYISEETSSKGKILRSFDYLKDWLMSVDFRGCGFQNIFTDLPKDQQKIRDQVLLSKNELHGSIKKMLHEDGEYTNKESDGLGDEIIVLMEGAIILSQIQKNTWPILAAKNACAKLLN